MYAGDWLANVKLRRCSPAARGAFIDIMCLMHGSDEYGVLRWPLREIARAVNAPLKVIRELAEREVLKGADSGAADYVFTPRHAGKVGDSVVLVPGTSEPCWYCGRMVRDNWLRQRRGATTRFNAENQPPKPPPNPTPKPPFGCPPKPPPNSRKSDGLSVSVSESTSVLGTGGEPPQKVVDNSARNAQGGALPTPRDAIFGLGVPLLIEGGQSERNARAFLGKLRKTRSDTEVREALERCALEKPLEPVAWLQAALSSKRSTANGQSRESWRSSDAAVIRKGRELGIEARPGETKFDLIARIDEKLEAESAANAKAAR
jgi:hypothetical protein